MLLASFTWTDAWQLLVLIIVVHVVLLAPVMVAIIGAVGERGENEQIRRHIGG